ncbi:MAG: hypothetical protein C4K47_09725 [Candidatus Thorarchaeota archaeon]|nr:MAG: hypothetical protein C4K47_09725 [Candidatus Thorarchaeota archaeon]
MKKPILPEQLIGHFLGVGSVGETDPKAPLAYVKSLRVPYAYELPRLREEDMIRRFAALVDGFEDKGDFVMDIDMYVYRDITEDDSPLLPDEAHAHSLYLMTQNASYNLFKTQQPAPGTMCFSTRGIDGRQLVSRAMFHLYSSLMSRAAMGQMKHLSQCCKSIILCQDDPALGFVSKMLHEGKGEDLTLRQIVQSTERVYPVNSIPAYHYCDDWRGLIEDDWYVLWDGQPRINHIDLVSFKPEIESDHAERLNSFLERGGSIALGVLPNVDSGYSNPVVETLRQNLEKTLQLLHDSGVDLGLLSDRAMISTQCGLSSASSSLCREIHEKSKEFPTVFRKTIKSFI